MLIPIALGAIGYFVLVPKAQKESADADEEGTQYSRNHKPAPEIEVSRRESKTVSADARIYTGSRRKKKPKTETATPAATTEADKPKSPEQSPPEAAPPSAPAPAGNADGATGD